MRRLRTALCALGLVACTGEAPAPPQDAGARRDVGTECERDDQCDDRVACTRDRCVAGRCVAEPDAARCGEGSACDPARGCLPRRTCASSLACADTDPCTSGERCAAGGYCVFDALPNDTPCGGGRVCRGGACACPAATPTRCGEACVDLTTDPLHCGACGTACGVGSFCREGRCACPAPQTWCPRGGCTDTRVDTANCGACGNVCNATARCDEGRCLQPCAPGTHRCGDTCAPDTSPMTCGGRCTPCPDVPNGRAACVGTGPVAECGVACNAGFHACGTRCVSNDDLATCGARCTPCPPVTNGRVACVSAACRVTCDPGYHACGERCVRDDDVATCGARCEPCPAPANASATCASGACGFTCNAGFRRCGDICSDGTSPLGCGPSCTRCPVPANGAATCAMGACGFTCNAGHHACGDACRDDTSPASCGARCEPCVAPAHASATCAMGACGFACDPGWVRDGAGCREQPRPLWPPSGAHVTGRRPTFRWTLPADAMNAATLELCRDRACARAVATLPVTGTSARPAADLPRGPLFWRVRAGAVASPSWRVVVGGLADANTPVTAWGDDPDFDADGFADLAAGAPLLGAPGPRVHVYRGTAEGLTPLGRVTLDDPLPAAPGTAGTQFGWSLAASDFNGDGYTDLAVGAPAWRNSTGRAYLYLGGPMGLSTTPAMAFEGPDGERGSYGWAVAAAGDLDADGYNDLAVGAYGARSGRVYVYPGNGRGVALAPVVTLDGPSMPDTRFGIALAGAGDVDGDGDAELLVGAPEHTAGVGRAFLYRGARDGLARDAVALFDAFGGRLGTSVAGVGDVNGDGYCDLAVGAPALDNGTGRVHVYHGAAAGVSPTASRSLTGPAGMEGDFGTVVVAGGDTNGDGYCDLAASAPRVDTYTGRAYLFRGGASGVAATPAHTLLDAMAGARALYGGALGAARDVDADGFDDLVVTAERASSFAGQVTILRGSTDGLARPTVLTGPEGAGGRFGFSVAWRGPVCARALGS